MLGHNLNQITFYRHDERNGYMKSVLRLRLNNVIRSLMLDSNKKL